MQVAFDLDIYRSACQFQGYALMMKTGHFEFVYPATPRRFRTRTNKGGTVFLFSVTFFSGGGYCFILNLISIKLAMTGFLTSTQY